LKGKQPMPWPKGKSRKPQAGQAPQQQQAAPAAVRRVMKKPPDWDDHDPPTGKGRFGKYHRTDFDWRPDVANEIPTYIDPDKLRELERSDRLRLQWVTTHVFGQEQTRNIKNHTDAGWTFVEAEDDLARWLGVAPVCEGLQLMARSVKTDDEAREHERRKAASVVATKREGLIDGNIPGVSLDSRHPSARRTNKINRTYERITIPGDEE
jgi:hypothetical protein